MLMCVWQDWGKKLLSSSCQIMPIFDKSTFSQLKTPILSTSPCNVHIANLWNAGGSVLCYKEPGCIAAFGTSSSLRQHSHTGKHIFSPHPPPPSPHLLQHYWLQHVVETPARTLHTHKAQCSHPPTPLHSNSKDSNLEQPPLCSTPGASPIKQPTAPSTHNGSPSCMDTS